MADWRDSKEYRVWRVLVIRRDVKCIICGSMKGRHAHHINHAAYFPELRFDPNNGVCLCDKCHTQFHTNFMSSFREKSEKKDFLNFLVLVNYIKALFLPGSTGIVVPQAIPEPKTSAPVSAPPQPSQ